MLVSGLLIPFRRAARGSAENTDHGHGTKEGAARKDFIMTKQDKQELYCRHCGRVFTNAGEWMNHDCDAQPVTVAPAQRDTVAIMSNAPKCKIEEDGDCLWA